MENRNTIPMENENTAFINVPQLININQIFINWENKMVRKEMYRKILQLKQKGLSKTKIADALGLNYRTVTKYLKMSEQDFRVYQKHQLYKGKLFDPYMNDILDIYKANNNQKVNMAAIYDYLEEKHGSLPGSERSLRNFIYFLITTERLTLNEKERIYKAVPELPLGRQMQLDFGQYCCPGGLKLYILAALLSSSRYKFAVFQDTPFTTKDVILHLLTCFDYFGGIPEEMVIDQDKLMVVSENKGDIIYTNDFSYFIDEMDIRMYVCRKADPESKGKIENFIGYIKHNFLEVRDFNCVAEANNSLEDWLIRRANGKISQATRRIPDQDIIIEREKLRPIRNSIFRKELILGREERTVSDKGYISVQTCQYLLPSKYKNKKVEIYVTPHRLFVFDIYTEKEIVNYELSLIPGKLVSKREFKRESDQSLKEIKAKVAELFSLSNWTEFLKLNYKKYGRYVRDQALEALKLFKGKKIDEFIFDKALEFCIHNQTVSMSQLNDTYTYTLQQYEESKDMFTPEEMQRAYEEMNHHIDVKCRNFAVYKKIVNSRKV
jgi:transposase